MAEAVELKDRYVLLAEQLAGRTKAMDRRHGGLVAVERQPARSPAECGRLMERVRRVLELPPHPALPVLRDEFRIGSDHWMISTWVDGTVAATGSSDDGDPGHAATVLARLAAVAEALDQLHQQSDPLVHGALAPETIIIRPDNRIVLTGLFGLPGPAPTLYLAPEVRAGQTPTIASDVYGLAAVAWLWLTGQTPNSPMPALLASSRETTVLEQLLRSGLALDPADRPASPTALVHRLDHRFRHSLPVGTVTFLMTDVCGSTELWQQNPAAMAAAIDRHDRICAEQVELFNGVFPRDQGEGDSMLAAFSRASDAVACAATIQHRLSRLAPPDLPLEVRMALHTGEASVRNGNYRCIAVNTCARIRALARGNQVLLSPVTAEIVRATLPSGSELIDLGDYALKGLTGQLRVFQLSVPGIAVGRRPVQNQPATAPAPEADSTALLGRGPELSTLFAALDSALAGRPRSVLVLGGPGTGKTRLVQELAQHASTREVRVLWGRCSESTGTPDYWPWQQVVRALTEDADPQQLARYLGPDRDDLCAAFGEFVAAAEAARSAGDQGPATVAVREPGPASDLSRPERRFQLCQAFLAFLRRAAADRPILILLDDLHWGDQPSILLLEFLAQHVSRARLLIVATFAEVLGTAAALQRQLSTIARQPGTDTLVLRNLNLDEVARFVETFSKHRPSAEVIDTVAAVSEGNPFYLHEIVDLLTTEGHLGADGNAGPVALSRGVSTVLRRRLGRHSDRCAGLLSVAAVIGREFPIALAAAVARLCSGDALTALDEALASRLVVPVGDPSGGRFLFSHNLIRQSIYDALGQTERTRLHLAVAEVLEQSVVLDVEQRGRLAHHLLAATPWSDLTEAIRWARVAAEDLAARDAHEECAQLYRAAVDAVRITPGDHGDVQYDLQLSEAEAWWKAGRPDRCTAALRLLSRQNLMVRLPSREYETSAVQNSAPGPDPKS